MLVAGNLLAAVLVVCGRNNSFSAVQAAVVSHFSRDGIGKFLDRLGALLTEHRFFFFDGQVKLLVKILHLVPKAKRDVVFSGENTHSSRLHVVPWRSVAIDKDWTQHAHQPMSKGPSSSPCVRLWWRISSLGAIFRRNQNTTLNLDRSIRSDSLQKPQRSGSIFVGCFYRGNCPYCSRFCP